MQPVWQIIPFKGAISNMELRDLGFDQWFHDQQQELHRPDCRVARVTAVNRDNHLVRNETSEVLAEPAGVLFFSAESSMDLPSVGDWVLVRYHNSGAFAVIHRVFPRKSLLRRKTPGKKVDYQLIASNIDIAFVVQSCDVDFNLRRLERYLVMSTEGQIDPLLLLTKTDLVSPQEVEARIAQVREASISCRVIPVSNETGDGLDLVRNVLEKGKTYCLLGSSGVGKTSLLNHLVGRSLFETNTVRAKDGKGRHTTARRQLIILDQGAMLIDTPGMRELGTVGLSDALDESFSEITELATQCRFSDCTHTCEVGCALLEAVNNKELSPERYQSYLKLMRESEHHQMSYLEKRRKDRKLGQFFKSAKKQNWKK